MIDPQVWWYLARAAGVVSWALLTTTVIWGLLLRTRLLGRWVPWAWTATLHRFLALLAVAFTGLHLVGLVADSYVHIGWSEILVPFASSWRPAAVAFGVIAGYLMLTVVATSVFMHRLSRRWWHRIHLTSYLLFWLATLHGLTAGTDAGTNPARAVAFGSVAAVLALTLVRTLTAGSRDDAGLPRFHRLTVADVRRETADAVSVAFRVPPDLASAFRFRPGQYLTVRARIGGVPVTRPYSICSSVVDGELRIAVRRMVRGRLSTWLTTRLRPGQVLEVAPPAGSFTAELHPYQARHVLGVAAGSGITPVLSVLASVLAVEPGSRCTLVYGNRTAASTLFARRLVELARWYPGRLRVVHVYSREPAAHPLLHGRIDRSRLRALTAAGLDLTGVAEAFVCGPAGMAGDVTAALVEDLGLPRERVRSEVFTPAGPEVHATGPARAVTVRAGGTARTVPVRPGQSVLDAGLRAGLDLPFDCRVGVCGTCRAEVCGPGGAPGDVRPTCQLQVPESGLTVDFDAVGRLAAR